jgi:hypothetical protein
MGALKAMETCPASHNTRMVGEAPQIWSAKLRTARGVVVNIARFKTAAAGRKRK